VLGPVGVLDGAVEARGAASGRVALAGLLLGFAACTSVRSVQPAKFFAVNSPDVVWVTDANNTVVAVADAEITADTLKGMRPGTREPVAIPLDQVQTVKAKTPDHMKTALLLTTLGVGAVSSVYFMWISKAGEGVTIDCANDAVDEHPDEHPECF